MQPDNSDIEQVGLLNNELVSLQRELVKQNQLLQERSDDLAKRMKELNCLDGISHLMEEMLDLDETMQQAVELLPPAWQYPEITCACIFSGRQRI